LSFNVTGQGDVYKSKWFGYTLFDFLSDKDMPNDTFDTMENVSTFTKHFCS